VNIPTAIGLFFDSMPLVRRFWRWILERNMEIEIKRPHSEVPEDTLLAQVSTQPFKRVIVDPDNPHIWMWADLILTNHRSDRREVITQATLHLKKRRFFFWHRTIAQAPVRIHEQPILLASKGPLLKNIVLEPMSLPRVITVNAQGPIQVPIEDLPKTMWLYLELKLVGPIRRMNRLIDTVHHNPKMLNSTKIT
jgi:hypothetical protein